MQQILLRNIRGTISLTNHLIQASIIGAGTVSAAFNMNATGVASGTTIPAGGAGDGSYAPEWLTGGGSSAYEVRWTTTAGALSSGTAGVWLNLDTSQTWTRTQGPAIGSLSCTGTVEIRDAMTLVVLDTATIDLVAERT